MSREVISRIITKDKALKIPDDLIHFFHDSEKDILDIPLNMHYFDIMKVREDFGKFSTLEELRKNSSELSENTNYIIKIIQTLGLRSFIIEHIDDLDWVTLEFEQFVVKDGKIINESILKNTNAAGDLYSTLLLGYDYNRYKYNSYKDAIKIFNQKNEL